MDDTMKMTKTALLFGAPVQKDGILKMRRVWFG